MISGVNALSAQPAAAPEPTAVMRHLPAVLAGLAGCLLLVAAASPRFSGDFTDEPAQLFYMPGSTGAYGPSTWQDWLYLATAPIVTALGLCLLRWWPYLLAAAALMAIPGVAGELTVTSFPYVVNLLPSAGYYLAVIALLACAQGLLRTTAAWGAAIAALTLGARMVGTTLPSGLGWDASTYPGVLHLVLLVAAAAGIVPAVWQIRRTGPAAGEDAGEVADKAVGRRSWRRARLVAAGTLAAAVPIPLSYLSTQRLADLLGVTWFALVRHGFAQTAAIGAVTVVAVAVFAIVAGRRPLAGTLTLAVVQAGLVAPAFLAVSALDLDDPVRRLAALAAAGLGAAAAASRWRFPLAAALTVLSATALFIAYAATTGQPEKLADQRVVIPSVLILVLCTAAAAAVVGATASVLAPRGALPAVLGPLAGAMSIGLLQIVQVTYLTDGEPGSSTLEADYHLTTSAVLLLVAGAAIGALGFAQQWATRRAERKHAEQIRHEAAAAERDRLARPIHDGVLQVLALVQRHGSESGGEAGRLAALAGEQELALRSLLAGEAMRVGRDQAGDLRVPLQALAGVAVEVATPAEPVVLSAGTVAELTAAVRPALDNVRRHAGSGARAWILVEDEVDGVRVSVRDDGAGFPPQRLAQAATEGRLGVAQSMRGRIADCGGTTTMESRPGEGTEVEFWVPRKPAAGR